MKKWTALLGCTALMLAGCSTGNSNQATGLSSGEYGAILPYESSNVRGKHVGLISDLDVRYQLEQGLMELSRSYFNPSEVGYKSHFFLTFDELDATNGGRGLLGTLRDNNPNGLNPGADEQFDTGNGIAQGPILLVDLYELDFFRNDDLAGISIGLCVADQAEVNGQDVDIATEKMQDYLNVTSNKLVSYMRERFNEIGYNIPILVAAYQINTDQTDSSKGGYIYSAYFNGSNTDYQTVDEQYVIVPSGAFSTLDPDLAAEFKQFKNDMATVLADTTYTTGEAKFENGKCVKLNLNVTTHGKTAGEILAAVQSAKEKLSVFKSDTMEIRVEVINNDQT